MLILTGIKVKARINQYVHIDIMYIRTMYVDVYIYIYIYIYIYKK